VADETTLKIVLVGEGGRVAAGGGTANGVGSIGPPGAPISPQGTPPPQVSMQVQTPPTPPAQAPAGPPQVIQYRPGMTPPPVQQPPPGAGGASAGAGGAANVALALLQKVEKLAEFPGEMLRLQSAILQQELQGNILAADAARTRRNARSVEELGDAAGLGPAAKITAGFMRTVAQFRENFLAESDALRSRSLALAPYSGLLARQVVQNQIAQQQRTIAEAQFAGPRLAEFERARNEREAVEQQIRAIKEFQEAGRKTAEEQKAMRDILIPELQKLRKEVGPAVAKALEEAFRNTRRDPIDLLLGGITMPGPRDDDTGRDVLDQLADQQANRPQFGGLPG
jgi:hypothetical protein